jgi:hypothetical protein
MELYSTTITHNDHSKTLYTRASDVEEAASKFYRFLTCQWCGYPWHTPEDFLNGVFDLLIDASVITVDINGFTATIDLDDAIDLDERSILIPDSVRRRNRTKSDSGTR